jgi:hypothetical protein
MNPTPLASRALVDTSGATLREALVKLFNYAKARAKHLDPKALYYDSTKSHLADIKALLLAAQEYSSAVDACLGNEVAPALDLRSLTPAQLLTHREANPVYRLGFVRGYKRGFSLSEQRAEHLVGLYARHALLVAPPSYTPSPLVARVNAHLYSPTVRERTTLSPDDRFVVASISADNLPNQDEQLWAS